MRAIIAKIIETWEIGLIDQCVEGNFFENKIALLVVLLIAVSILGYLIGSVNFAVIISKKFGEDIRDSGSGNAGATNMSRAYGKKIGALTLALDALKAAIACIIGILIYGSIGAFIAGFFCILGHAFPVYFKFKGGKGVACMAAVAFVTSPLVFFIMLAIYMIILIGFKMVSLASVMSAMMYPLFLSMIHGVGVQIIIALLCAALIVFLHRKNLARIFNHEEPKIEIFKKKRKKKSNEADITDEDSKE